MFLGRDERECLSEGGPSERACLKRLSRSGQVSTEDETEETEESSQKSSKVTKVTKPIKTTSQTISKGQQIKGQVKDVAAAAKFMTSLFRRK